MIFKYSNRLHQIKGEHEKGATAIPQHFAVSLILPSLESGFGAIQWPQCDRASFEQSAKVAR